MAKMSKEEAREMRRQLARARDFYLFLTDAGLREVVMSKVTTEEEVEAYWKVAIQGFRNQVQELCAKFDYLPKTQAELLATAHAVHKLREMQAQQSPQELYADCPNGEYRVRHGGR